MAATPIPSNQATFTPEEILEASAAVQLLAPSRHLAGVAIDSRAVAPGNVFVALVGASHDAHDYLSDAIAAGAHAVVVSREVEVPEGVGVFRVEDTLGALGALGGFHRRRYDVPVVAITGSVGKTSTKELVAAALTGAGMHTVFTRGNLNNRIGVPMTLFTLDAEHDAAVIEIGMNVPGEIADLADMARPTVGVVTSVAEVHTEGVGGLDGVAREKGALLDALGDGAAAVWCHDYPWLAPFAERSAASHKLSYGLREGATVRLIEHSLDGHGATHARYRLPHRELEATLTLLGEAAAVNAAGALAVVEVLDPTRLDDAAAALASVPHGPHRMVPIELVSGLLVVDDSYNASPASTVQALATASALAEARGGALVAVLGDMLELGPEEQRMHASVGRAAVEAGVAALVACGERMSHAGRAALSAAMERPSGRRARVVLLRNVDDAAECVRELVKPNDVVLVKGSRGMRMERVVEALRADDAAGGAS
jgi:UDP-N-acetylmuramoyl-tripeptide--D-alanyl-D-alanine ligase